MKIQILSVTITLTLLFAASVALGTILDVPHDFSTIESALHQAESGDQISIAPGQYFEYDLVVPSGVIVSGTGATPEQVVIDAQAQGRIMICESLDETTLIQNITFINGAARGGAVYDKSGGAILLNNSNLRLFNCRFINNSADGHGGALRFTHASPQLLNCYFEGNSALEGGGGAVDCSYESSPRITNCFFKFNEANWGGALSCRGSSSPIVTNSNFDRNRAEGGLGYGGAVIADHEALPYFEKCTFYGNHARYGGGLASFESATTNLNSCTLVGNSSEWLGAGIICSNSFPVIENSIIAFQNGSAIACGGSSLPIIRCTNIYGNSLGDWVGTIAAQGRAYNNMEQDPLFCGQDPESNFEFRLQIDSPCGDESTSCGAMGAWPVGCGVTPIYLDDFAATWADGVPQISWNFSGERSSHDFILMRSRQSHADEEHLIPFIVEEGGYSLALDHEFYSKDSSNLLYTLYLKDDDGELITISRTQLSAEGMLKPLHLVGAYPNPFNPRTTISFETSRDRQISITVHNIRGQQVQQLAHKLFPAGRHQVVWSGENSMGQRVESGTYFVTIRSKDMVRSQKVLLLK